MEYHWNFLHTHGRIQNIDIMSIIDICYTACNISTKNVAHTLPGFQGTKRCIQYLDSHPHKPLFSISNSYDR